MSYKPVKDIFKVKVPILANLEDVTLSGVILERMLLALNRLSKFPYTPDIDGKVPEWGTVIDNPGTVGVANSAGDTGGRWFAVMSKYKMCLKQDIPLLRQAARNLISSLNSEGYYGPIEPPDRMTEYHAGGMTNMIRGLIAYSEATNDPLGITIACQLADKYYLPRVDAFINFTDSNRWILSGDIGGVAAVNEAMAYLYMYTSNKAYLEFAKAVSESWMGWDYCKAHAHVHSLEAVCRGLIILYLCLGDKRYLEAVSKAYQVLLRHQTEYMGVSNWIGEGRYEGKMEELQKTGMYTEGGCGSTDWLALNCWLWRVTGETHYLDQAEMVLFNSLMGHQERYGGWCCYSFKPYNMIKPLIRDVYWCCNQWGALGYTIALEFAYVTDYDAALVNFYLPGKVTLQTEYGPLVLEVDTDYPNSGNVKLTILESPELPIKLYFRVPFWCKKPQLLHASSLLRISDRDGYLGLKGYFKKGDEVLFSIDLPLRIVDGRFGYVGSPPQLMKEEGKKIYKQVALFKGPVLLVLDQKYNTQIEVENKEFILLGNGQNVKLGPSPSELKIDRTTEWKDIFFKTSSIFPDIQKIYLSSFADLTYSDDPRAVGIFDILEEENDYSTSREFWS